MIIPFQYLILNNSSMKTLAYIIGMVCLLSCNNKSSNQDDTDNIKKEQLKQYKQEFYALKQKITALEAELAAVEEEHIFIKADSIVPATFESFVEVIGTVEVDMDINISPEGAGEIASIEAQEGQQVKKGEIIARLNTTPIERSIDELKINLTLAQTVFQRQQNLWDQKIGSEIAYLEAKTNKEGLEMKLEALLAQLDMSVIKSPIDGAIDIIYQKKGEIASPQIPFAKVINIRKVNIYADVSETYLTKIHQGDQVQVYFPSINRKLKTTVVQIGNVIHPQNRTFRIKMTLNNSDSLIKPNMVAIVKFRDYIAKNAISLPALFIKEDFNGKYVFIVTNNQKGENIAQKVYIETGMSNNNLIEIKAGLNAGDRIITQGFNQVTEGSRVTIKIG
jgi:membrane fusion protein (multidrug efflux system)